MWKRLRVESVEEVAAVLAPLAQVPGSEVDLSAAVARTLAAVRRRGDEALVEQVRAFDWPCPGPERLRVPSDALRRAWEETPPSLRRALQRARASILRFHRRQRPASCRPLKARGVQASLERFPLASVGLYAPGGRAAYPSTLLMLALPAQLAGVRRIAVASPVGADGLPDRTLLAAASLLGLEEVYGLGGAAAVGAFAYGTATVPRVDKIFGPGNAWVTEAKRQAFGTVGIDAVAGPTELVILSDGSSPASFIASDLLAQAEHDERACALLLTTDPSEPQCVEAEMARQLEQSPRSGIQRAALSRRGGCVVCASAEVACAAAEFLAPEHLSVQTAEPEAWADRVPSAAAVFLGPWCPEAAGDYGAGPNHSLPTGGTARFSSPVTVWDFVRYQSRLSMTREALCKAAPWMESLARAEGLFSHGASLRLRSQP